MTGWRSRLGATTGRSQPTAPIWTNFAVVFAGCRLPCPPRMRTCRAAAIRPTRRPHLPRCPMLSGDPAYVCASVTKDRFPGETGHEKAPWTIRQDHPGGKAPALTSENAARSSRTGSRPRGEIATGRSWPPTQPGIRRGRLAACSACPVPRSPASCAAGTTRGGPDEPGTGEPGHRVRDLAADASGCGLVYVSFGAQYRFKLTSLAPRGTAKEDDDQSAC